jgi:TIR domain
MAKIFVSYLRRDKNRVARLVKELTDLGAEIWWDEDSLAVGDRWRENIDLAIRECSYFIPCFSAFPDWHTSTMEEEVRIASGLWRGRGASDSKWILPVKLEEITCDKTCIYDVARRPSRPLLWGHMISQCRAPHCSRN